MQRPEIIPPDKGLWADNLVNAAGGDQDALRLVLVEAERRILGKLVYKLASLPDPEHLACGILSEQVEALIRRVEEGLVDPGRNWWGLLYRSSMNAAIDLLRKERRQKEKERLAVKEEFWRRESSSPEGYAERAELLRRIRLAIDQLSDLERQVVYLKYFDNYPTFAAIARKIDQTYRRVRTAHTSGLAKLRTYLSRKE